MMPPSLLIAYLLMSICIVHLSDALTVNVAPAKSITRPAGSALLLTCSINLSPSEAGSSLQLLRSQNRGAGNTLVLLVDDVDDPTSVKNVTDAENENEDDDRRRNQVNGRREKRQATTIVSVGWVRQPNAQRIGSSNSERVYVELDANEKKLKLIFTQLRDTDTATYLCSARRGTQSAEDSAAISVTQPTQVTKCDENQEIKINTAASIVCEAFGSPSPIRTWSFRRNDSSSTSYDLLGRYAGTPMRAANNLATITENTVNIDRVSYSDAGRYEIRFEIEAIGDIQTRYVNVHVIVPPSIEQTRVDNNALQHGSTELSCQTSGTAMLSVRWFRKSDLKTELNAQLSTRYEVLDDGSRLRISQLQPNDTGEYVCVAMNNAGEASASLVLEVKTVPEIIRLPTYQTSLANKTVEIRCVASGSPPLDVRIYKIEYEDGTMIDMSQSYAIDSRISVQTSLPTLFDEPDCDVRSRYCKQQVLTVGLSRPTDTANYTCVAKNDAGTTNRSSTLEIFYGPIIEKNETKVYGYDEIPANLTCLAFGKPIPEFSWQKVGRKTTNIAAATFADALSTQQQTQLFASGRNYRMYMQYFPRYTISILEITINSARADIGLSGFYRCTVTGRSNSVIDSHTIEFAIGGPPKSPINCSITVSTANYARIRVEPPSETGGFPLTGYVVNYRERTADGSFSTISSDPTSFKINELIEMRGLRPQTEYRFQVAAKNRIGVGAQAECLHTTPNVGPPSPPEITSHRMSDTSHSYELSWQQESDGGLPISQYAIRYRPSANSSSKPSDSTKVAPAGVTSLLLDSLLPGTVYEVELSAINTQGASVPTSFQFETLPSANVSVAAVMQKTTTLSKWMTIGIIAVCAVITLAVIDITCYYWKACGFTHTFCIMCCHHDKRQAKTQYNFEAAERRYLMTLERSKEHSRVATPLAGVSPSVERKDSPFSPAGATVHSNDGAKQTNLLVVDRHGDIGMRLSADANNNSNSNNNINNNNNNNGFAAAQIHAAPPHSVGNGNTTSGSNYYA